MLINNEKLNLVQSAIENLDLNTENYHLLASSSDLENKNFVYIKGDLQPQSFKIKFIEGVTDSIIFIGDKQKGKGCHIRVEYSSSLIYIGGNCNLKNLSLRGGNILIGDAVSSHEGRWQAGVNSREVLDGKPNLEAMIIVGDDCMFSRDITIRTSDAHPIYDFNSNKIVNLTDKSVFIEPHVWVCEKVSIMKGIKIGACSILALGAVVTKDVPRNSSAGGVPAVFRSLNGKVWARNTFKTSKLQSEYYFNKYINI
ncbi:acyltransferase [Bermanella sp. WJH001]|uniref:acyltransferase n=1 Tax=Bermanella sp. WJH001 TaxID=3048005 RepID=UPI0024BE101F|nr:acyltransferase [Bermanella sp. WJH001]MDJ1539610.1 acyltransferase [Bermanella sp. WJH001]